MSTTTKINYAKETKALIKDGINRLGGELTNLSTFRSYASVLNAIYNALPKVSGTGSNLSLSPTLKGGLDITPIGNCEQGTTTGKNKLKVIDNVSVTKYGITASIVDGKIKITGTTDNNIYVWVKLTNGLDIVSGTPSSTNAPTWITENALIYSGQLSFSYIASDISTNIYAIKNDSFSISQYLTSSSTSKTEDFTNNTLNCLVAYLGYGGTSVDLEFELQAVVGSTADFTFEKFTNGASPNPSFPQNIRVVTGDNDVVVQNKNLVLSKIANVYLGSNGAFSNSNDYDTWIAQVTQGETYTVTTDDTNLVLGYYETMPTRYSVTYNNSRTVQTIKTFTAEITGYVSFRTLIDYSTPQLELGSTATSYVAHQEQKVTLHLGSEYLAGIGDYKDEIQGKKDDWKIVRNVGKVVLDGSENWAKSSTYSNMYYISNVIVGLVRSYLGISNLTNNFIEQSSDFNNYDNCLHIVQIISNTNIDFKSTKFDTVEELKTYLNNQNLIIYYVTPNETEETITDTTLIADLNNMYDLMGYDGQTNITITSNSANAQMTAQVKALKGE